MKTKNKKTNLPYAKLQDLGPIRPVFGKGVRKGAAYYKNYQRALRCPACSKRIKGGNAIFTFGSVMDGFLMKRKKISARMIDGYCGIFCHGVDEIKGEKVYYEVSCDIARNIPDGQMDIYFCSLECLRNWFGGMIDKLECRASRERKKAKTTGVSRC